MRRLALLGIFALVVSLAPADGAEAVITPDEPIPDGVDLMLAGGQILYSWGFFMPDGQFRITPAYWFAGFISTHSPAGPIPMNHPKTWWLRRIVNNDTVTHHLTQCGVNFEQPVCTLFPGSRVTVEIEPGEVILDIGKVFQFDEFADGQGLTLTCEIHPGLRARFTKHIYQG